MRRMAAMLALLLAFAVPAAADIRDFIARPIVSVTVIENGRTIDDARIVSLLATKVGDPLAMTRVRESIAHLFSLGRYEDVRADAEESGTGVAITYTLAMRRTVTGISFSGVVAGVDEGALRRTVQDRFGTSPREERGPEIARLVQDQLVQRGFLHASATTRLLGTSEDTATLVIDLVPGPRTRIGSIVVRGDAGMSERQLIDHLDLKAGAPYERGELATRVQRYLDERRRAGFYEARLSVSSELANDDRDVNLTLTVSQGFHVRVVMAGDPLPAERRDELVPVAREGSVDQDLLEDSANRIRDYLRGQGYRDASADYTRSEESGELRLTFTVHRGALYRVARIQIEGASALPLTTVQARLRVHPGQPLSDAALDADLAAIESTYQREGFASARAESVVTPDAAASGGEIAVGIRIQIAEGPRTMVGSIRFAGNDAVDETTLLRTTRLKPGAPFAVIDLAADRDAIQLAYANLGYPTATVTSTPGISADGTRADVVMTIREGIRVYVDHILIIGNLRTRTSTIERELQFKSGDPLGLAAVNESQRRLAALGLFRRARITELGHGDESRRDILVTVEEAPVTTIGYGGGLEVGQGTGVDNQVAAERLEIAPRAFFEVGRRNLWGKNRSVDLFTRVSLRSKDVPQPGTTATDDTKAIAFREYRVIGTFREPRVIGTGIDTFLTATIEQQARSSFDFARRSFSAEAGRRITPHFSLSGNYQIQRTKIFDELVDAEFKRLIDRAFPQVRLSSFSLSAVRDTRNDLTDPVAGHFMSANGQIAGRRIGSEVGFAKTYLIAQTFQQLPSAHRTVFAASVRLGAATGFPRQVPLVDDAGRPILDANGEPQTTRSVDLPASERFFAGGDTTIRGFALDQVGTPDTIDKDGFPVGGGGLVIFNAELRVPVRGGFGVVGFVDAGNVFARPSAIDLLELRSAVGFGFRYKSPIGPIRVDLGFKTERRQIAAGSREGPTSLHISLGQAF